MKNSLVYSSFRVMKNGCAGGGSLSGDGQGEKTKNIAPWTKDLRRHSTVS